MSNAAVGAYRALLRLYPRTFRDEYGADMALLFDHQLRDEPAGRVWARTVIDLAITVPARHLEAHMTRPPSPLVPLSFAGVGFAGLCLAVIGGSSTGILAVGLSIAVAGFALAAAAWRFVRPVSRFQGMTAHWWKFVAAGAAPLAAVIVATSTTGEVDGSMWWPMMITVICALALLGTGLALGVAHRGEGRPRSSPS